MLYIQQFWAIFIRHCIFFAKYLNSTYALQYKAIAHADMDSSSDVKKYQLQNMQIKKETQSGKSENLTYSQF